MTTNIDATLQERGKRYGSFKEHARIAQAIKKAMRDSPNWESLPDDMKETLEMNAHKTARILNGDPFYHDSWHDINGYTKLVADELIKEQTTTEATTTPIRRKIETRTSVLNDYIKMCGLSDEILERDTGVPVPALLQGGIDMTEHMDKVLCRYFGVDNGTFIQHPSRIIIETENSDGSVSKKSTIEIQTIIVGSGGLGSSGPTPDSQPNTPPPPPKK